VKFTLLALLNFYQRWVSPLTGPRCRFYPSCSSYFKEALETHGALTGTRLGVVRLLKCHPLHAGGYDPCPDACSAHEVETHAGVHKPD